MGNSYIQSSRLRSIRTRKRITKTDYEKYLRTCYKRERILQKQKYTLPLIPLEKPYQKGFVRYFVLREDVKQGKHSDFFEALLKKINIYQYAENRKFQKKKRRRGKRIYIPKKQELHSFSKQEWERALERGEISEKERMYFIKVERYDSIWKRFETYYEFAEPWRFVLRIRPNMITHYRPLDLEIEHELAELSKVLDNYKNRGIIQKKVYCLRDTWKRHEKRYVPKAKYKRSLIKETKEFRTDSSALEIAEMLLDSNFY